MALSVLAVFVGSERRIIAAGLPFRQVEMKRLLLLQVVQDQIGDDFGGFFGAVPRALDRIRALQRTTQVKRREEDTDDIIDDRDF